MDWKSVTAPVFSQFAGRSDHSVTQQDRITGVCGRRSGVTSNLPSSYCLEMAAVGGPTPLCDSESIDICDNASAAAFIDVLCATSFVVNIIHIMILRRLPSLKGKLYLSVLVSMSCVDMWFSISTILANNCQLRTYISTHTTAPLPALWNMIIVILMETAVIWRYVVQCMSSVGRFLAVVRPYIHSSSFLIAHIGKVVFGLTLFFTIIIACKSIGMLNMDVMCVHSVMGPISLLHISSGVLVCVLVTVPSVLISILISLQNY